MIDRVLDRDGLGLASRNGQLVLQIVLLVQLDRRAVLQTRLDQTDLDLVIARQGQILAEDHPGVVLRGVLDLNYLNVRGGRGLAQNARLGLEFAHRLVVNANGRINAQRAIKLLLRAVGLQIGLFKKTF